MPPVEELLACVVVAVLETVTGDVALVVATLVDVVADVVEPVLPPEPCVTRFVQPAASATMTHP